MRRDLGYSGAIMLIRVLRHIFSFSVVCLLVSVVWLGAAWAQDEVAAEPPEPLPEWLAEKVKGFSPEKMAVLLDPPGGFADTRARLHERFRNRTTDQIEAYIDGMLHVLEVAKYNAETDQSSVELNTENPRFNMWKTRRPDAFNPERAPGPIDLTRYMRSDAKMGIQTFFRMPVALTPADLIAGNVDVAIMGVPLDFSSGMRGAGYGPRAVRNSEIYGGTGMTNLPHLLTLVSPFNVLNIVDYGDVAVNSLSTDLSLDHIREMVREVAETGAIPMIVGGDHSLMYPDVAGVVDVYGKGNVGIIHFDAHYDAGQGGSGLMSHGQPVYRLVNQELVPGKNFIQVGLRGFWPGASGFKWMREHGFRYHTMADIERNGWDAVMKQVMEEALDGPEYIYISFDVDVLDPAFMPGTGTPEPGGLLPREVFPLVRRLCAEKKLVGFELVELNPLVDPGYTSALNANRILRECLTGIAMNKEGITDPHYLAPLTVDDGNGD